MNRDQRLLLLAHGAGSVVDVVATWSVLAFSTKARLRYRRFNAVSDVLRVSLADPDETVVVRLRPRRRSLPRKTGAWIVFGVLAVILFFEYRTYTIPVLYDAILQAAHRCGLH